MTEFHIFLKASFNSELFCLKYIFYNLMLNYTIKKWGLKIEDIKFLNTTDFFSYFINRRIKVDRRRKSQASWNISQLISFVD